MTTSSLISEVKSANTLPPPAMARAIRLAAGVQCTRMAAELNVHPVTLARWEAGTRTPRGPLRAAYAALLVQLREASN